MPWQMIASSFQDTAQIPRPKKEQYIYAEAVQSLYYKNWIKGLVVEKKKK